MLIAAIAFNPSAQADCITLTVQTKIDIRKTMMEIEMPVAAAVNGYIAFHVNPLAVKRLSDVEQVNAAALQLYFTIAGVQTDLKMTMTTVVNMQASNGFKR